VTDSITGATRQIARAAGTVMAAFVLSNLIGLVRQSLISREFGTKGVIDAYFAASTYPELVFSLIAGGALASAFVPTVTGFLTKNERKSAWYLVSAIANLVILLMTFISLISAILAPWIVGHILAPKFSPPLQYLTTNLLRILLISPIIFGVSGLCMGMLNAHQIFLWPALGPSMYSLGMIFGVLFLTPSMGIYGLAWGAVLGALLHLGIQIPAMLRLPGRRYFLTLGLRFAAVREVGRLMAPRLLGVGAVQINFVVNVILATGQPEGSLTALKNAWVIMAMPQVVIAQAIAIAALPTFSSQAARGAMDEMRGSLAATLRGVILLSLPATLGLILLRVPLTRLLYERGEFDAHSTQLVALAVLWYATGLIGHSFVEIVSRAFYALHNTLTPVLVSVGAMSLNIIFSIAFSALFQTMGDPPLGGLALANSLATTLEMFALLVLMRRRLGGINGRAILVAFLQTCAAGLCMVAALVGWLYLTQGLSVWIVALVGVAVGGSVFILSAWVIGIPEVRSGAAIMYRRLGRKLPV
jgi:putative peptidoglycan lipid II flippase